MNIETLYVTVSVHNIILELTGNLHGNTQQITVVLVCYCMFLFKNVLTIYLVVLAVAIVTFFTYL